jgi:hypothetical protein
MVARSVARAGLVVLVAGALAGCTAGATEPPGLTASPTVEAEAPSPSPTPTLVGPVDRSDEAVGIVFEDLPQVTGDALTALDTLTLYELEEQRATTTGEVDPALAMIASPDLVAAVQFQVDSNTTTGWTVGGELVDTVDIVDADAHTAHATVCRDLTGVLFTQAGVTYTAADLGFTDRTFFEVILSRSDASVPWMVDSHEQNGAC